MTELLAAAPLKATEGAIEAVPLPYHIAIQQGAAIAATTQVNARISLGG